MTQDKRSIHDPVTPEEFEAEGLTDFYWNIRKLTAAEQLAKELAMERARAANAVAQEAAKRLTAVTQVPLQERFNPSRFNQRDLS